MSGYSGTVHFTYEIERYKHKQTGALMRGEQSFDENDYDYTIISLTVEGSDYFRPGKFSGPPENCYPDEGETEIRSVIGPDGKDWEDKLSDEEREEVLSIIQDEVEYNDDFDPDIDYDSRFDREDF